MDLDESDTEARPALKSTAAPLGSASEESSDEGDDAGVREGDEEDVEEMDGLEDEDDQEGEEEDVEEDGEEDEEEEEESEAVLPSDLSDNDDEEGDEFNGLDTFAAQLDAADREKATSQAEGAGTSKKRRVLPVISSGPAKSELFTRAPSWTECLMPVLTWQMAKSTSPHCSPLTLLYPPHPLSFPQR